MKLIQNLAGMSDLTEQVIASDFLMDAKTAIRSYAIAITEATTPEVRKVLRRHLDSALYSHEKILKYMMANGWYDVYNPKEQMEAEKQSANTVMKLQ